MECIIALLGILLIALLLAFSKDYAPILKESAHRNYCPTCDKKTKYYWLNSALDGSPDLRFAENYRICKVCDEPEWKKPYQIKTPTTSIPGVTITEVAKKVGWYSRSKKVHNTAVLWAASNADFHGRNLLFQQKVRSPNGFYFPEWHLTEEGLKVFIEEVLPQYPSEGKFHIEANTYAQKSGHSGKRHVVVRGQV